jgi:hypothetical protein
LPGLQFQTLVIAEERQLITLRHYAAVAHLPAFLEALTSTTVITPVAGADEARARGEKRCRQVSSTFCRPSRELHTCLVYWSMFGTWPTGMIRIFTPRKRRLRAREFAL